MEYSSYTVYVEELRGFSYTVYKMFLNLLNKIVLNHVYAYNFGTGKATVNNDIIQDVY